MLTEECGADDEMNRHDNLFEPNVKHLFMRSISDGKIVVLGPIISKNKSLLLSKIYVSCFYYFL